MIPVSFVKRCLSVILFSAFLTALTAGGEAPFLASAGEKDSSPFPAIEGWKLSGPIQAYPPQRLYEYINGAADLYLSYDFQELKVAEYLNPDKASITIEVYRHRRPEQSFGIYSQERLSKGEYLDIGTQGYREENVLNFLKGSYYVKISAYKLGPGGQKILDTFARKVADRLEGKSSFPSILSAFPTGGKKPYSEKFLAKNILGYSFLHSAFTADYEVAGKKFKLLVIEGTDPGDSQAMIQAYLRRSGSSDQGVPEGHRTLTDPYHGVIELGWKGKYIWMATDLADSDLRSRYLRLLEEGLQRIQ